MRIFVTGASGFIGGAIAKDLVRDHEVLAMSRSQQSDVRVKELGAEPVRCDLTSLEPGQIPECDAVIHCAAFVEPWGSREVVWAINVEGTRRVLSAAKAAGGRRFLHMSTEAVLWKGQNLINVKEDHPYAENSPFLYSETKAEAERIVRSASCEEFETITLRPRFVWGPGDQTLAPEIESMVAKGAFMWIDGGRATTSTTHIDNLVHGAKLLLDSGLPGEVYFVTDDENCCFRDFLPKLMGACGVELGDRSMPSAIARPAAALVEGLWRVFGIASAPPLTRHAIGLMACDCTLNIDKIKDGLGYQPIISVSAGLEQLKMLQVASR